MDVVKVGSEDEMLRLARIEYDKATDDQVKLHCLIALLLDEVSKGGDVEQFHKIQKFISNLAASGRISFETYLDAGMLAGAATKSHERICTRTEGVKH